MQPRSLVKLALLIAGVWLTTHFAARQLAHFFKLEVYHWLFVYLATWAVAGFALLYIAFTPYRGLRIACGLLVALSTLAGQTYFLVSGDHLTLAALDAMWVPGTIVTDTVVFYGRQTGLALLMTLPLALGLLIAPPPVAWLRWRPLMLAPLAPCFLTGAIIVFDASADSKDTRALPEGFHVLSLATLYAVTQSPTPTMAEVDIPRVRAAAARHLVLIVDESVSGDFIDVNVPRGTTPYLSSYPAGMANFGLATAASTCSNTSNALLRMGANPVLLNEGPYSPLANPSIWKYARAAGFETHFIDAQGLSANGENFMSPQELRLIDQVHVVSGDVRSRDADQEAVKILVRLLEKPHPQFIYLNKKGVHFPYRRFAGDGVARFRPAMERYESVGDRERLVNSYKNAITRMVDLFFETLLPAIDLADTVVIYTSDHGQNLLDDGKPITHCRRLGTVRFESLVPLLAWAGDDALRLKFQQAAKRNFGAASHFEIFPTLLDLLGYDPSLVQDRYHQGLLEPIDEPMGYLSGPLAGRFGFAPAWNPRGDLTDDAR